MLKRSTEFLTGAVCYFGVASVLSAISFLGDFAVPVSVDVAPRWPLMHMSVVKVIVPPAHPAVKE